MGAKTLGAGAGGDVVRVGGGGQALGGIVLDGTGDKLRGCAFCLALEVVLVLQHLPAVGKIF